MRRLARRSHAERDERGCDRAPGHATVNPEPRTSQPPLLVERRFDTLERFRHPDVERMWDLCSVCENF